MSWIEIGYIGLGIVATLIGSIILKIIEWNTNKLGKVIFYAKIIHFTNNNVELKIEIKNTTRETQFIRQFTLYAFNENGEAVSFMQATHSTNSRTGDVTVYADEGFYSFTLAPTSLNHFLLSFFTDKQSTSSLKNYYVQYYDSKDRLKRKKLKIIRLDWQTLESF